MPKNKVQSKEDELDVEEKVLIPDAAAAEDGVEEADDEETLDEDEVDPFHDKWEE